MGKNIGSRLCANQDNDPPWPRATRFRPSESGRAVIWGMIVMLLAIVAAVLLPRLGW
jgi:hypothetical protein